MATFDPILQRPHSALVMISMIGDNPNDQMIRRAVTILVNGDDPNLDLKTRLSAFQFTLPILMDDDM